MKVVADRIHQGEIIKACHEGIGFLQEARVLGGHFGKDKMGAMIAAMLYAPHILNE